MPNSNINNNTNGFYIKEMMCGAAFTGMGILFASLSASSMICFYDNPKNSESLKEKWHTITKPNNVVTSTVGCLGLLKGLDIVNFGRYKMHKAILGLKENMIISQENERAPLLSDVIVERINNLDAQQEGLSNRSNAINATAVNSQSLSISI